MMSYILIIFVATSFNMNSGVGGITHEFSSVQTCFLAGNEIAKQTEGKGNHVLSWGCFKK